MTFAASRGAVGGLRVHDGAGQPAPRELHSASSPVRVVVADGQALVRAGLRVLLEGAGRLSVVGEAATAEEALDLACRIRPEVVIMDANLPGLDCVEATRRMLAGTRAAVMLLTASEGDERMFAALLAGASGLVLKDTQPAELERAVEALARGEASVFPGLTRRLIAELSSGPAPGTPSDELVDELTAREREVMGLVAHGLSNQEIARRLGLSPATAKTHVSRSMMKLHARTRAQLVILAYETGLVVPRTDHAAVARRPLAIA